MCHSININPDPKLFKVDLLLHCKTILHESEILTPLAYEGCVLCIVCLDFVIKCVYGDGEYTNTNFLVRFP